MVSVLYNIILGCEKLYKDNDKFEKGKLETSDVIEEFLYNILSVKILEEVTNLRKFI